MRSDVIHVLTGTNSPSQHNIRDALTPTPAFVAVPSTPPPVTTSPKGRSSPSKRLEVSPPTLISSNPFSNDIALASNHSQLESGGGNYSLVGPVDVGGEDSEGEPGYDTVAAASRRRNNSMSDRPAPQHERNGSPQQNPKTGVALPPLPQEDDQDHGELRRDGKGSSSPGQPRATIQTDSNVTGISPLLSRNEFGLENGFKDEATTDRHSEQQSQHTTDAKYSRVVKPKKQEGDGRGEVVVSADLPPIAPQSSPPNKRGKEKSRSPLDASHRQRMSPRESSSQHRSGRRDRHHTTGPDNHPWTDEAVPKRRSTNTRPKAMTKESYSHSTRSTRQQRSMSESYSHALPPEEYYYEEDIDLPVEYSDESYLPSGEESDTITDSYFNDEGEVPNDYPDGSHTTPNRRQRHRRSRSATFPGHHHHHGPPPITLRTLPPHSHSPRHSSSPCRQRKRPATSEGIPLGHADNIPFLQRPPSLQPVYPIPQNQAYVFSEVQPDGRVQYYSATPVHSPPVLSPPPPPPLAPHPVAQSAIPQQPVSPALMMMTPSPQLVQNGREDGARHGGPSPLLDRAKLSGAVATGTGMTAAESGYFSNALATSQQGTVQHMQRNSTGSVSPSNLQKSSLKKESAPRERASADGGRGRSKTPQVSPTTKLLESSLQRANTSYHSPSPTSKSPRGIKSPRFNLPSGRQSPDNIGTAALYEQRERVLKARIKALEDSAEDLCTENASLKQLCEVLKRDSSMSD